MQHSGGFKGSKQTQLFSNADTITSVHHAGQRQASCGVDPEAKAANIRRLRRLEGQVRGLQKMVEEDRYCREIMIQISAAQDALWTRRKRVDAQSPSALCNSYRWGVPQRQG
jgi:Metal-sensitive transcriptional repressor